MLSSLSALALRRRRVFAWIWLVLAVAGAWSSVGLADHLSQSFEAPGRPAFETNRELVQRFGGGGVIAPIVAVGHRGDEAALRKIAAAVPHSRAVVGGRGLTGGDTIAALIFPPPGPGDPSENAAALAAARAAARGTDVHITGREALAGGGDSGGAGLLAETILGGAGALIVLIVVFASPLAVVPLLLAAVSILTTFLVLRGLAAGFGISMVVQFLVGLIGLGVAIDYSLLLIVRWREERDRGAGAEEAVRRAMETAGHAIVVSGTTVAIGLVAMVAVPVPFIRSIGVGGLLIPLISVAATLSLLPGLLASFGPRLDRRRAGGSSSAGVMWTRWSKLVVRRRWPTAIAGLAITGTLAAVAFSLNPGEPSVDALASSGPARAGLVTLERSGLGTGTLTPVEVMVPAGQGATAQRRLAGIDGVRAVLAPGASNWTAGGSQVLTVLPRDDAATDRGKATLNALRDLGSEAMRIGGPAAQDRDLTDA
ncbi:MAG TPA: MMPL family transporter, partial [Solirubrobacter sp.]